MAYPRNLLAPDEKVVVDAHTHWKALVLPVIVAVLAIAAGVTAFVWTDGAAIGTAARTTILIVVAVVLVAAVAWWAVAPYIRWATTHFVVTDRRVIYRTGVFTKSGIDIPLVRINSVQFRHGFVDRMFKAGTLIIESASDDPLEFEDIPHVEKVHARLYHEVDDSLSRDEDEPLAPTPGLQRRGEGRPARRGNQGAAPAPGATDASSPASASSPEAEASPSPETPREGDRPA
ncbi:PH domain-containing protein [Demequina pelophila]|uniref:PH domain-containing protein n=1 Tax=Demequina pelophila TaxID=1638984 RepID=UPI0009E5931B|nr:PH domain-containing protein [Demequina pelophila]